MPTFCTPAALSRSMIAIWFSGSPNQPPWLYRASVQPIFVGLDGQRLELPHGRTIRRSCSVPLTRSLPKSSKTQSWALIPCRLSRSRMIRDSRLSSPGAPRRHRAPSVPLQGLDLGIEARNVLGPPVVSEVLEAQPLEHRRPFLGPRFLESNGTMHQAMRLSRAKRLSATCRPVDPRLAESCAIVGQCQARPKATAHPQ